jgi:alkylhydroperoxidase family enzyme
MGHCEMLLAVAGLDNRAIAERIERLAGGDWSAFSPAERAAFRFARKQATDPAAITEEDFRQLVDHFGPERSLDVIWWTSRCHYMTRIADAFGLPLEQENVFDAFRPTRDSGGR